MTLILRTVSLCNLQSKNLLKHFPRFSQQIHYNILIHKPVQVFACFDSKISPQIQYRLQTNNGGKSEEKNKDSATLTGSKLSQRARLKQAVRDYGATIIVFHVTISLISLGICYLAVSSGFDVMNLLQRWGFPEYVVSSKAAVGGSTFVMAYAVHKLFAPLRIGITLSSAPFIVRYLRKIKLIKPPPK